MRSAKVEGSDDFDQAVRGHQVTLGASLLHFSCASGNGGLCWEEYSFENTRRCLRSYLKDGNITIRARGLVIRLSPQHSLSTALLEKGEELSLKSHAREVNTAPSDYVTVGEKDIHNFVIQYPNIALQDVHTMLGDCARITVPSRASDGDLRLERTLDIDLCPSFPQSAVFTATYKNRGSSPD
jgi:hypothetical protein